VRVGVGVGVEGIVDDAVGNGMSRLVPLSWLLSVLILIFF
jgi:hypothetical protein